MRVAMETKVGEDAEETLEALGKRGLPTKTGSSWAWRQLE
jgi:hypothetical protein